MLSCEPKLLFVSCSSIFCIFWSRLVSHICHYCFLLRFFSALKPFTKTAFYSFFQIHLPALFTCSKLLPFILDLFWNRKVKQHGRPMKRSKNVRKMKAIKKAISANEKSVEKVLKNENKKSRVQSAKTLYE